MVEMRIIKNPITKAELKKIAEERFGDLAKAVVDVEQKVMAVGGELHADMETLLMENENSLRKDTWGINLYPENLAEDFVEFDSMINLKPALGNRTRNVEDKEIQEKIKKIVNKLIIK
jgi:Icc-related predicted phosphoesterase